MRFACMHDYHLSLYSKIFYHFNTSICWRQLRNLYCLITEHVLNRTCDTGDTKLSAVTGRGHGGVGDRNETGAGVMRCSERLMAGMANII